MLAIKKSKHSADSSIAELSKRIEVLEQELATLKNATHEHTISPETVLRLADIIKADIAASLLPQKPVIEEEVLE